jgi:hypothetical protein
MYNLNYTPSILRHKVEEKLNVGVREKKVYHWNRLFGVRKTRCQHAWVLCQIYYYFVAGLMFQTSVQEEPVSILVQTASYPDRHS